MSSEYDVMIIDSDPDCRRTLEYILSTSCFETSSVPDGRKALEKMKSSPPDIIILSLTLPDIDGIRLLRMIRNRTENPVLVISSQNIEEEIVTAFETGADDFTFSRAYCKNSKCHKTCPDTFKKKQQHIFNR